ncbi:PucR family transcriptional regulator [Pseudomonas sp. O230]|uniref:PucR family transcriptional regulator n=1 Tax=Pseudomonas sp. O230 TaxID=3159450 RepID=UPI00387A86B3
MPITLNDLTLIPELRTRFLCGEEWSETLVIWAHVCELKSPAEWLGKGDLLMTTGMGIPSEPEEQRLYIERLHTGGLVGMIIGESMQAPGNLDALLQAGTACRFPVLMTAYEVPFSAVSKAVVEAYKQQEAERRYAITRVYETARMSFQGMGLTHLLGRLEKDISACLYLVDPKSLDSWRADLLELPCVYREVLLQRPRSSRNNSVVQRFSVGDEELLIICVPSHRPCMLIARSSQALDYGVLHHIVAVIVVELERIKLERETKMRHGSELFDDLLHKRVTPRRAEDELMSYGADIAQLRIGVVSGARLSKDDIDSILAHRGMDVIFRLQGGEALFLLSDGAVALKLQQYLDEKMGVSDVFSDVDDCANALREARLALAHASEDHPLSYYTEAGVTSPWLPQSLHDASEAFRQVLGALTDYDQSQGSQLVHTLRLFLENNRSWINTSKKLYIHKQTLVYRMRRIEEITGRSLDSTDDVAILWFAVRSADIAGIDCDSHCPPLQAVQTRSLHTLN